MRLLCSNFNLYMYALSPVISGFLVWLLLNLVVLFSPIFLTATRIYSKLTIETSKCSTWPLQGFRQMITTFLEFYHGTLDGPSYSYFSLPIYFCTLLGISTCYRHFSSKCRQLGTMNAQACGGCCLSTLRFRERIPYK